MSDISFKGDTL